MALISPGVQVTVTDESFFVPAVAPTVPLLFVATGAEKTQQDGITPAAGTFESGVVRTVTSLNQSVELYGEPSFLVDSAGTQQHGDARNEYGLFALNQYLGIGNRAFVVRADVNLDDDIDNLRTIWDSKFVDAGTLLTASVTAFLTEWNESRGLVATDALFRTSVTEAEFLTLSRTATDGVWDFSSFADSEDNYFDDHTDAAAGTSGSQTAGFGGRISQGQQKLEFEDYINAASQVIDIGNKGTEGGGGAAGSPVTTGLVAGAGSPGGSPITGSPVPGAGSPGTDNFAYTMRVIVDGGSTQTLVLEGLAIQTWDELVGEINFALTGAVADFVDGNIRITSVGTGATSAISILDGANPGSPAATHFPLLASLTDFVAINTATKAGTNLTGLINDATSYVMTVVVNTAGSPTTNTIDIQGQNAQTYTDLVTQINAQLSGATAAITSDGNILVWSDLVSATTSSIAITDTKGAGSPGQGGGSPSAGNLIDSLRTRMEAGSPLIGGSPQSSTGLITLLPPTLDASTVGITNPTGLNSSTFTASFTIDGTPRAISVTPTAAQLVAEAGYTYGDLITDINTDLGGTGSPISTGGVAGATLVEGNIVVTSATTGTSSTVSITDTNLFSSLSFFVALGTPTAGTGVEAALSVYANGYDVAATGTYDGLEGISALWVTNSLGTVPGEWTSTEASSTILAAADDYKFTVEFRDETRLGVNDTARRATIVTALQASVNSNTEVRSDAFEFTLVLCPGYHEVADELVALATDVENEAFVIGETPLNLTPTETVAWAGTSARVSNTSIAYYYPHAFASNIDGVNVLAGASGVALRTYAFTDKQAEVWFAPAGTRRGLVTGVTQVGYVNSAGTFVETNLNLGQRDDLYKSFTNINPIVFFTGRGIVVWGQKTSSPDTSARDRVNVERLIVFVRRSLRKSLLSFVFEPNDALTRDSVKAAVDNFLGDLVVRRGLFDFATVVDETNNTPQRIDANELWVDVALQPVKAAEFIIVPIRIVATGTEI